MHAPCRALLAAAGAAAVHTPRSLQPARLFAPPCCLGLSTTLSLHPLPPQVGIIYFIGAGFWTIESLWSLWVYK